MSGSVFDATILLEQPPEIEVIDGLFYVTDKVGAVVIRRVLRPHTFLKLVRAGQAAAAMFAADTAGAVVQLARTG